MYKGIIFDLDGTLLDTSEGVLASIRHTIKTMNYRELPLETLLTFIGPPVKRSLMKHYGLTDQEADEATEVFRQQYKNKDLLKAKPYDGILELLKALKDQGFLVGVATLKREDYAHTILEHFGIAKLCDLICGSDFESRMTKTDVLRKCLSGLGLELRGALNRGYLLRRKRREGGRNRLYGRHLWLRLQNKRSMGKTLLSCIYSS